MSSPLRVLIVDDDPLLRWSLAETLSEAGCAVTQAIDCASALGAVTEAPHFYDVVLVDCRLPDGRDLALVAQLRQRAPSSAIVLMTAFGTPDVVRAAHALGVSRILNKPFDIRKVPQIAFAAHGSRV